MKMSQEKIIITNAFSLAMIQQFPALISIDEISEEEVKKMELESAIGHESTAQLLSTKLGKKIEFSRKTITLKRGDVIIVAQLMGPRKEFKELSLEEIQTYPIKYLKVKVLL